MGDWMHAVSAADPLIGQLNEGAEVRAPQPAGALGVNLSDDTGGRETCIT